MRRVDAAVMRAMRDARAFMMRDMMLCRTVTCAMSANHDGVFAECHCRSRSHACRGEDMMLRALIVESDAISYAAPAHADTMLMRDALRAARYGCCALFDYRPERERRWRVGIRVYTRV